MLDNQSEEQTFDYVHLVGKTKAFVSVDLLVIITFKCSWVAMVLGFTDESSGMPLVLWVTKNYSWVPLVLSITEKCSWVPSNASESSALAVEIVCFEYAKTNDVIGFKC